MSWSSFSMLSGDGMPDNLWQWMEKLPSGLIYLSGPMSGFDDLNKPAFDHVKQFVAHQFPEARVISPPDLPDEGSWETCLRRDLHHVADAHALVMLKHWLTSKGARLEFDVAERVGIPAFWWPSLKRVS